MPNSYKKIFYSGLLAYVVFFIYSVVFYRERASFMDTAYFLYNIVKDSSVTVQNYRFISIFTEIFPLLARKMNLSLNTIMLSYSTGFIIYYLICYLICGFGLKNYKYAIGILLLNLLFVTHTFYWMVSELQLGLPLLMLMLAFLQNEKVNRNIFLTILVFSTGLTVVYFAHPLTLFPIAFVLLYMALHYKSRIYLRTALIGIVLFAVLYYFKDAYYISPDDANRMNVTEVFFARYRDFFDLKSTELFIKRCKHVYYWIPLCSAIIGLYYLVRRCWLKLALFTGFMAGYILLVNIVYFSDYTPGFYIENLYLPLSIFILLPLIHDIFPFLEQRKLSYLFVGLIVFTGLVRIYNARTVYTERVAWMRSFIKENIDRKLLLAESKVPMDKLIFTWASPYEFWLLSTSQYDRTASIIISDHFQYVREAAMFDRKSFLMTWGPTPYDELPPRYFIFKDTVSTYTILE